MPLGDAQDVFSIELGPASHQPSGLSGCPRGALRHKMLGAPRSGHLALHEAKDRNDRRWRLGCQLLRPLPPRPARPWRRPASSNPDGPRTAAHHGGRSPPTLRYPDQDLRRAWRSTTKTPAGPTTMWSMFAAGSWGHVGRGACGCRQRPPSAFASSQFPQLRAPTHVSIAAGRVMAKRAPPTRRPKRSFTRSSRRANASGIPAAPIRRQLRDRRRSISAAERQRAWRVMAGAPGMPV